MPRNAPVAPGRHWVDGSHSRSSFAPRRQVAPLRGLLFDMGDVLYDATIWRRWLLNLLMRMGIHTTYRSFFRVWDKDFLDAVHRGQTDYQTAFLAFLRAAGLSRGQIDEVVAASNARKRELEATVRPLAGVATTLAALRRQGTTLAVLSDSESTGDALAERLGMIGLGGHFSVVISSRDLGTTKPDPRTYHAALSAMNMQASEVAFVGHDAEELDGAFNVGMRTFAFNYDGIVAADVFLPRFQELLQHVPPCVNTAQRGVG